MGPHQRISRLTDVIRGRWTRERAPKALRAPPAADEAPAQLPVPVTAHSLFCLTGDQGLGSGNHRKLLRIYSEPILGELEGIHPRC